MNTGCLKKCKVVYLLIAVLSISCSKMDAIYSDFLKEGELIYPAKADSLKVHPGDYKIKLSWVIFSDPKVSRAVVYWDNRRDSTEVTIPKSSRPDTIEVLLTNME